MEGCGGAQEWRAVVGHRSGGLWWGTGVEGCGGAQEWRAVVGHRSRRLWWCQSASLGIHRGTGTSSKETGG